MKVNPDKFQFMILGPSNDKCFTLKINAIEIRNTSEKELLGLTIDHKLKFDAHMANYARQQGVNFIYYAESENSHSFVNTNLGMHL